MKGTTVDVDGLAGDPAGTQEPQGRLLSPWVGWTAIGTMAVVLVAALLIGDMVPVVYYLVTLVPGTMLLIAAARA